MTRRYVRGCDAVHPDKRGGQHVAKPCTGVLVIDDDRGIGVFVNSGRSQHMDGARAETLLDLLLLELDE